MTNTKSCRSCKNLFNGESLLNLPGMPNAVQNLPDKKNEAIASGTTLDVWQCSCCGLVQLANDPVPYYKDVIRAGSVSPSMRKRQLHEFRSFIDRFSLQGKNILEIGCGRGEYLAILKELPVHVYGLENNSEYCRIATERGFKTYHAYPSDLIESPAGFVFDAFISINFLEHAPDPSALLRSCANLLSEDGAGMIAVPDFEFELQDNYLFSFMSDHLLYFSADSLRNTLTINGFEVVDIFRNEKLNVVTAYIKKRQKWNPDNVVEKFYDFKKTIHNYMDSMLKKGGRIAFWGASHLAFSVISASKIEDKVSYLVDSAPFKQNKFAPSSGLRIYPPQHLFEDPVETIIIMCPEYSDEIVASIKENFSDVVRNIATFIHGELKVVQ